MSEQIIVPDLVQAEPESGETAVSTWNGLVVLHLPKPIEHCCYPPASAIGEGAKFMLAAAEADPAKAQLAIDMALKVVDMLYEHRGDLKPIGGAAKHELIERHRKKLTARYSVMLSSLRERKTLTNHKLAKQLVDAFLHEVFS